MLEAEADAQCDVSPVEISFGQNVEFGTDVQGELDGHCLEVVFQTSLSDSGKSNVTVTIVTVFPVPVAQAGTDTGEPTEISGNGTGPLVDAVEVEGREMVTGSQSEIQFQTVATQSHLIGEFGTVTLTAAQADTKRILCIRKAAKCD